MVEITQEDVQIFAVSAIGREIYGGAKIVDWGDCKGEWEEERDGEEEERREKCRGRHGLGELGDERDE